MSHSHVHGHVNGHVNGHVHGPVHGKDTSRRLALSVLLTLVFVAGEAAAGIYSHSLALLSDAGHNLADALALIFSWYGIWIASKPADANRTYGFHRVSILAALVNAVSLVLIALVIFWEAAQRLNGDRAVHSTPMIVVASLAVVLNSLISWSLSHGARHDLSVRSAYLHMLGDAISAVGVVGAGVIIHYTGSSLADPIVSFLIGALILFSSWEILGEAVNILLEASPKGLDMLALETAIREVQGVLSVHDLHVWTLSSGITACSCHIQVTEQSIRSGQQVLMKVVEMLKQRFSISHTTVQVEVEGCAPDDIYCTMKRLSEHAERGHQH